MYEGSDILEGSPTYIKGDIVWVKLSGYWWPGEVKNEEDLPSDLISDFKKRPLVIVKFFEEESYEYIKHWANIYPYNCEKKSSFIKKGMAGFRAKLPHLATFPRDIGTAEEKTNGNPNILSQPEYLPSKKIYYDEIFGDATPKKGKIASNVRKSTPKANDSLITHRRFLGNDDYKAYIMLQHSDNDYTPIFNDEEIEKVNQEPDEVMNCQSCSFTTMRLGVMLWHSRMHLEGLSITKRKNKKVKHIELSDGDSETEAPVAKPPNPKQRRKKVGEASKSSDLFTNLLEEWDDTDEDVEEVESSKIDKKPNKTKSSKTNIGDNDGQANKVTPNGSSDTSKVLDNSPELEGKNTQEDIKNCFDFDEEEDEEDFLFPASTGRKIPRVIPEKPRASISELLEQSEKEDEFSQDESEENKNEEVEKCVTGDGSQSPEKPASLDSSLENTFKELMEETEVPVLDNLSPSLKPEQNFHDARTIKFPDKGGTTLKGSASPRSGASKKRFITSFEDFEAGFRKINEDSSREKEGNQNNDHKSYPSMKCVDTSDQPTLEVSDIQEVLSEHRVDAFKLDEKTKEDNLDQKVVLESDFKHLTTDTFCDKAVVETRAKTRRIRQLVIGEDSEEFIEFIRKPEPENSVEVPKTVVEQYSNESAITVDAALEALTKDIGVSPTADSKIKEILECTSQRSEMSLEQLRKDLEGTSDSVDINTEPAVEQTRDCGKLERPRSKKSKRADRKQNKRKLKTSSKAALVIDQLNENTISSKNKNSASNSSLRKELQADSPQSDVRILEENEVQMRKMDGAAEDPSSSNRHSFTEETLAGTNENITTNMQISEQNNLMIEQPATECIPEGTIKNQILEKDSESVSLIHSEATLLKSIPRRGRSKKHSPEDIATNLLEETLKDDINLTSPRSRKSRTQKLTKSDGESLEFSSKEIEQNTSTQDDALAASSLVENVVPSNNEDLLFKTPKSNKQNSEEIHKPEDHKLVDDIRRTRSHKSKPELLGPGDEDIQLKKESSVVVSADVEHKTSHSDVKSQAGVNVEMLNIVVSTISEDVVLGTNASKIRKSPRRKSTRRDQTVSPVRELVEIPIKTPLMLSEEAGTENEKVQNTPKTQELTICDPVPSINRQVHTTTCDKDPSLQSTSISEKLPRLRRRKTRWNVEAHCATLAIEGSEVATENSAIETTKNAEATNDSIIKDLNALQISESTETLADEEVISKTRSGKALRVGEEVIVSKIVTAKPPDLPPNVQDSDVNKSLVDDASSKLDSSNLEEISQIPVEVKENCLQPTDKTTFDSSNQGQINDQSIIVESVLDIPLPDKPLPKVRRGRSQKLEHEKVVDVIEQRPTTDIAADQPQLRRRTRSSRLSDSENKFNAEKRKEVETITGGEKISGSHKATDTIEAHSKSVSNYSISLETENHNRQTPNRRHTRRSEQNYIFVQDGAKVKPPHSVTSSDSEKSMHTARLNKPEDSGLQSSLLTDFKEDKPESISTLPAKETRRSKIQRSEKLPPKTLRTSEIKGSKEVVESTSNEPKIIESVCDVGLDRKQHPVKHVSARKQDVCSVTGIVSDVTYGRKSSELRSGKSKVVKNRWDVVSCARNNQQQFESKAESVEKNKDEENVVQPVLAHGSFGIQEDTAVIMQTTEVEGPEVEESKGETVTETVLKSVDYDSLKTITSKDAVTGEEHIPEGSKVEDTEVQSKEPTEAPQVIVDNTDCSEALLSKISESQIDTAENRVDQRTEDVNSSQLELLTQNAEQAVNKKPEPNLIVSETSVIETADVLLNITAQTLSECASISVEKEPLLEPPTKKPCLRKSEATSFLVSSEPSETSLGSLESEIPNADTPQAISVLSSIEDPAMKHDQITSSKEEQNVPKITTEHLESIDKISENSHFVETESTSISGVIQPSGTVHENNEMQVTTDQAHETVQKLAASETNIPAHIASEISPPSNLVDNQECDNLNLTTNLEENMDCDIKSLDVAHLGDHPVVSETTESKMDTNEEDLPVNDNETVSFQSHVAEVPEATQQSHISEIVSDNMVLDEEAVDVMLHCEEINAEKIVPSSEDSKLVTNTLVDEFSQIQKPKPDSIDSDEHDPIQDPSENDVNSTQQNLEQILTDVQFENASNKDTVFPKDDLKSSVVNEVEEDKLFDNEDVTWKKCKRLRGRRSSTANKMDTLQNLDKPNQIVEDKLIMVETAATSDLVKTDVVNLSLTKDNTEGDLDANVESSAVKDDIPDLRQKPIVDKCSEMIESEISHEIPENSSFEQAEETIKELPDCQLSEPRLLDESNLTSSVTTSAEAEQSSLTTCSENCDVETQPKESDSSIAIQGDKAPLSDVSVTCVATESSKLVPPKKNRWSRRGSYANQEQCREPVVVKQDVNKQLAVCDDFEVDAQISNLNSHVIDKTDHPSVKPTATENLTCGFNDSDIILPPKKSKRANDSGTQLFKDCFSDQFSPEKKSDADLQFPNFDDSFMSSSFRNNIEGLIKEIDSFEDTDLDVPGVSSPSSNKLFQKSDDKQEGSSIKHTSESIPVLEDQIAKASVHLNKCVPPKKKKIDLPKDDYGSDPFNQLNQVFEAKEKVSENIPETPKKKMQKIFESSQVVEKVEKTVELPQMSPLAKKKSFLFQQELDRLQKVDERPIKDEVDLADNVTEECNVSCVKVKESANLLKPTKKRKSLSYEHSPCKKEKLDNVEEVIKPEIVNTTDPFSFETTEAEIEAVQQSSRSTSVVISSNDSKSINEQAVKSEIIEETEPCSNQASTSSTLIKSEELPPFPEKVEVKSESLNEPIAPFDIKREGMVSSLDTRISGSSQTEPEMVPISVAPTVMSEQDLADAQVEITSEKVISEKKPTTLGTFSVDFPELDRKSVALSHVPKATGYKSKSSDTLGTEFTTKAMVKEFDNRSLVTQQNTYVLKSELLDILEGNSNSSTTSSGSEQKFKTSFDNYDKQSTVQGIIDFEDAIPSQIVLSNKVKPETVLLESPKLLERLAMAVKPPPKVMVKSDVHAPDKLHAILANKSVKPTLGVPKPGQKIIIKNQRGASKIPSSKPVILSEQIIRPAGLSSTAAKQASQSLKRPYEDVEDIETAFIIPKIAKKIIEEEVTQPTTSEKLTKIRSKASGKAKILQQTIISAKGSVLGEIVPQASTAVTKAPVQLQQIQLQSAQDESVFDINSMPIVLSDDLLTAESIQNMPVVLSEDGLSKTGTVPMLKPNEKIVATLPKKIAAALGAKQIIFKSAAASSSIPVPNKLTAKVSKPVTSSATVPFSKFSKSGTTAFIATGTTADGKPAKYVLVPPTVTPASTQVKSLKPATLKKTVIPAKMTQSSTTPTSDSNQVVGNKIMIVTNAQGQQTRVVLTPQQQKVFMQGQAGCKTKTIIKGAIPKALLETAAAVASAGASGIAVKTTAVISQGATASVSNAGGLLMSAVKTTKVAVPPKKTLQRPTSKPQKTILIKNQLGQTVRKIQGTDDADLDRQVAEQLEAIKASARLQQSNKTPEIINYTSRPIPSTSNIISNRASAIRKAPSKKIEPVKSKIPVSALQGEAPKVQESTVSALSQQPQTDQDISAPTTTAKKQDQPSVDLALQPATCKSDTKQGASNESESKRPESPLRQVVIQDGLGNLTTVTVGQILAIPSETVDGQPQSYMLVTVDESGNLTPLNNDALMSLDPSLGAGGDINNMVLQVDQTQGTIAAVKPAVEPSAANTALNLLKENVTDDGKSKSTAPKVLQPDPKPSKTEPPKPQESPISVEQQVVIGDGILPGDVGGQQLIVTGDPIATQKFLESLSDGSTDLSNILANAENGNVLIQADGQQILIRTNPPQSLLGNAGSNKETSSSLFASHKPSQDILAAALANTDVFPSTDQSTLHSSIVKGAPTSQISPGSALFPMHVGNVLETSLTLSSPIMTPLEIPSTNSKKIDAEADILSQVPKNVDLPITITDPNISQTVANQQAASLGALELTLPIPDSVSSSISSPSYAYSLPTLEDSVGISQKSYSSSMPLLTEDAVESESSVSSDSGRLPITNSLKSGPSSFSPNFGTLPMLESMESSREEVVRTSNFGDLESLPMLADDIIEDSGSSIGSAKLPRTPLRSDERDIVDEGLSTLGGEMCSSLSEPPPDMFDLSSIAAKEEEISSDLSSIPEAETLSLNSENSGEIPLQPPIVANLNDLKRAGDDSEGSDEKKPRFE